MCRHPNGRTLNCGIHDNHMQFSHLARNNSPNTINTNASISREPRNNKTQGTSTHLRKWTPPPPFKVHAFHPSLWETEDIDLSLETSRLAWSRVSSRPKLHSETLSQNKKSKQTKTNKQHKRKKLMANTYQTFTLGWLAVTTKDVSF